MNTLKALVIGMGALIVVGLALVGYGLYRNTHPHGESAPGAAVAPAPSAPLSPAAPAGFFSSELPVLAGSRLEQVLSAGDRLVLRFSGGEGDRLVVLDPRSGQVSGTVQLIPQPR